MDKQKSVRYANGIVAGVALLILGAGWLVSGSVSLARRLGISVHGAKRHVANVLAKLDCSNRTLAVAKALRQHGIPYEQLEADDDLGRDWYHGLYESAHIISSRRTAHLQRNHRLQRAP
jgi:hypothetical protein